MIIIKDMGHGRLAKFILCIGDQPGERPKGEVVLTINPALLQFWPGGDAALIQAIGDALAGMAGARTGEPMVARTMALPDTPTH